ncbi:MAG: glycoside hydrolase family 2 [Chitinophagaceae bacterium]|nr:glycoside hydrolase family 2 [Chitinophagaceae bacterium]
MRMRKLILCICVILLGVLTARSQRIIYTINSGWKFHKGDVTGTVNAESVQNWEVVNIPHTWNDKDAFDDQPGYYRGVGWYAKELSVPSQWKGKNIFIQFEGVNQETDVFINGKYAGNHKGGYTAFNFEISNLVNYGQKNLITVKADNKHDKNIPPLNADFTFYGGIYRNVHIIISDAIHFDISNNASDGVFVETPSVSKQKASVRISGKLANNSSVDKKLQIQTSIFDKDQHVVARKISNVIIPSNSALDFQQDDIEVINPKLWSPVNPYLYHAVSRVVDDNNNNVYDEITLPVGLRWYSFTGEKGFMLNGEAFKLIGTNRHQDFSGKGNALTDDYHSNDYTKIKELGFNFVRLAHYPQAQEVYRTCDELGLLVWSEIPIVNEITQTQEFTNNCLNMQREHVRQTRNHPSIILYGYMNEVLIRMLSSKDMAEAERRKIGDSTAALAKKLNDLTKKEAPAISTVMALHGDTGYNKYGIAFIPDVIGWNLYFGWYYGNLEDLTTFLNDQHQKYPSRPLIVSEFGADADIRNHTLIPRPWDYSEDYENIMHASYIKQMLALKYLSGFAAWNFADFGAENRTNTIPFINQKGLVTYDRKEKDAASLYRAYFTKQPVVYLATHNNTKRSGTENTRGSGLSIQPLSIFTNLNKIELLLNGKSLGLQEVKDHQVSFNVPFQQGINLLEATDKQGHSDKVPASFNIIPTILSDKECNDLAVNAGSFQYFLEDETHVLWVPDQPYKKGSYGYIGGSPNMKTDRQVKVGIANNILDSKSEPLFQTFDEGIQAYRFDVQDGKYTLMLCFMEPDSKMPATDVIYNFSNAKDTAVQKEGRVFNVLVNGKNVIDNLNLARDYGAHRAVTFNINTTANNHAGIEVKFDALSGKPVLCGIRIKKTN